MAQGDLEDIVKEGLMNSPTPCFIWLVQVACAPLTHEGSYAIPTNRLVFVDEQAARGCRDKHVPGLTSDAATVCIFHSADSKRQQLPSLTIPRRFVSGQHI